MRDLSLEMQAQPAVVAALSEECNRLFRARKTVVKMLKNRGYIVTDEELKLTAEQFMQPERGLVRDDNKPERSAHTLCVEKQDDPDDTLFVFFPDDMKVGMKPIRTYCERMKEESVKRAILVVRDNLTPFAKQAVMEMRQQQYKIEYFRESELLVDITEHVL